MELEQASEPGILHVTQHLGSAGALDETHAAIDRMAQSFNQQNSSPVADIVPINNI